MELKEQGAAARLKCELLAQEEKERLAILAQEEKERLAKLERDQQELLAKAAAEHAAYKAEKEKTQRAASTKYREECKEGIFLYLKGMVRTAASA